MAQIELAEQPGDQSLWRVRLDHFLRGLRLNWRLFVRARIGLVGLAIIAFYFLLAAAHPILMRTVWDEATYNPVTGYAYDETRQPAPPASSIFWERTRWGATCSASSCGAPAPSSYWAWSPPWSPSA